MDQHVRSRLVAVLEAEGLDALCRRTTENLQYLTGFRSIAHALFRGLELYGVFTRQGVGLVIPFIDATGVSADGIAVDRIACYGKFFFNYADAPGPVGARVREITSAPAASPADALLRCWAIWAHSGSGSGWTRRACFRPRGSGSRSGSRGRRSCRPTRTSGRRGWSRARRRCGGSSGPRSSPRTASRPSWACSSPASPSARPRLSFEQEILRKGAQPFFTVVTMGERAALADVYASERALAHGGPRALRPGLRVPGLSLGHLAHRGARARRATSSGATTTRSGTGSGRPSRP